MESILPSLIANVIFFVLTAVFSYFHKKIRNWEMPRSSIDKPESLVVKGRLFKGIFLGFFLYFIVILSVYVSWSNFGVLAALFSIALPLLYLICKAALFIKDATKFLGRAEKIGIGRVDTEVETGINYEKSLKMCQKSIRFLGIGANKLVTSGSFEDAIRVCSSNSDEIHEFIICNPSSKALSAMEKRNNQHYGSYKKRIIQTLRRIKELQDNQFKIEVYLYDPYRIEDLPVFRLFFVDGNSVLVSFYVVDSTNDDGRKLPQIQFLPKKEGNISSSFYFAFDKYYSNIKSVSKKCVDLTDVIRNSEDE